ncbi:uncharacterized protein LOC126367628 [Pectinophora gossypiella]|uniref:uncharacterized protein LOC126367628 n=1 Tax=Pectinophora gossypiella TaxID=13191 RepID=UPI00214EFE27|nr:uncharacterized protein LOC126367628 [Pectinophora gossypiella]
MFLIAGKWENSAYPWPPTSENDIEGACGGAGAGEPSADILSRLLCAVHGRHVTSHGAPMTSHGAPVTSLPGVGGVTPAGTDGSTPPSTHRHDNDPQLSTAAHTDMLLLNLMRMNGLTPKHSKHSPKRSWSLSRQQACEEGRARPAGSAPRRALPAPPRPRRAPRPALLSPGQLAGRPACPIRNMPHVGPRTPIENMGPVGPRTPPGTPERLTLSPLSTASLLDAPLDPDRYPVLADGLSDNEEDTLFDMLLNSLSLESPGAAEAPERARPATPPVQPWSPPSTHGPHGPHKDAPDLD